jgi:hypothetical protein
VLNGEIQDISASGAFIRLADDVAAPRGLIQLEFETQLPEKLLCKWWSLVIRKSPDGIGVMFDQRHNETAACRMRPPMESYPHSLRA